MTQAELNKLYESLTKEEALIRKELADVTVKNPSAKGTLQPKRVEYGDPDDEDSYAHEVTDIDLNVAMEKELKTRLDEVVRAKERIKAGQYGKCENCAQDIKPERLKVMPIAALCMDCTRKLKS